MSFSLDVGKLNRWSKDAKRTCDKRRNAPTICDQLSISTRKSIIEHICYDVVVVVGRVHCWPVRMFSRGTSNRMKSTVSEVFVPVSAYCWDEQRSAIVSTERTAESMQCVHPWWWIPYFVIVRLLVHYWDVNSLIDGDFSKFVADIECSFRMFSPLHPRGKNNIVISSKECVRGWDIIYIFS